MRKLSFICSIFLALFIIALFLAFSYSNFFEKEKQICGDGTSYEKCSLNKPYYCFNGTLAEKASLCGCPEIFNEKDNSCISEYHENPKQVDRKSVV